MMHHVHLPWKSLLFHTLELFLVIPCFHWILLCQERKCIPDDGVIVREFPGFVQNVVNHEILSPSSLS